MSEFPKYHKINSLYKRDMMKKGKPLIIDEFSQPEFEMLYNSPWLFTEKIDGMNVRILWDGESFTISGRTDNAQIPGKLMDHLNSILDAERFTETFGDTRVVLYGEGFGGKIQAHTNYAKRFKEETFVCFDIFINGFWLERSALSDLCYRLEIPTVPLVSVSLPGCHPNSLSDMDNYAYHDKGMTSVYGDFESEGVVGVPQCGLLQRNGKRIIVKIKWCDFK